LSGAADWQVVPLIVIATVEIARGCESINKVKVHSGVGILEWFYIEQKNGGIPCLPM
jgi:hypothetical protein